MLFAVIAVPLAIAGDLEGIVHSALPLALAADTLISVLTRPGPVAGLLVGCNLLVAIAAIRCAQDVDTEPYVRRVDSAVVALLMSSRTLVFMCTLYLLSLSRHANVVRTYAYSTSMYVVQMLGLVHVRELALLLDTYTVDATTRTPCVLPVSNSTGFLFADSPFVATCPTRVWEHVRINVLFAAQLYVLYTLTTDMYYDTAGTGHPGMAYAVGVLAVIECTAVSAAAATQFDLIAGCHELSTSVGVLLLVAVLSHVVRRLYCMGMRPGHPLSGSYQLMTAMAQPRWALRRPLRTVKLKL